MLKNLYEIDTFQGVKSIELHYADITDLDEKVDLVVVSAFKNSYHPSDSTVIGALHKHLGIDVFKLSSDPLFDLRDSLGVWMSRELKGVRYRYLACVDLLDYGGRGSIGDTIRALFALTAYAEINGIQIQSLAMPILGAGLQRLEAAEVLPPMLETCRKALSSLTELNRILLVEHSEEKVEVIDRAFNAGLGRSQTPELGSSALSNAVRDDLSASLKRLAVALAPKDESNAAICREISSGLNDEEIRFYELALLSRRLVEAMCMELLNTKDKFDLAVTIEKLHALGLAPWMISYMHTIRIFGNYAAHGSDKQNLQPAQVAQEDLISLLFCLNRVVQFWIWKIDN